jgi:putative DNA methylase
MTASNYKKKLIEVALPLEAINKASAREKSIRHGHPSTLHLWWARRPLATCRAILFAQLVDDPSSHPDKFPNEETQDRERARLFKIIEDLVLWENSNNQVVLDQARAEIQASCPEGIPNIYDPFSGGGSIPLEAQRLGIPSFGSDLNPVAVVIGKAMTEIPPKFIDKKPVHPGAARSNHYHAAQGLAEDIKYYGSWMRERAQENIGQLYPQMTLPKVFGGGKAQVIAWIWARTVPSPDPSLSGLHVPLVRTFNLFTKKGKHAWVEPIVKNGNYHFEVKSEVLGNTGNVPDGTVTRQGGRCLVSGAAIPFEYIREQAKNGNMSQKLMAVVAQTKSGRVYVSPDDFQSLTALEVEPNRRPQNKISHWPGRTNVVEYGLTTFGDLFTDRQLHALNTFSDLIDDVRSKIEDDALAAGMSKDPTSLEEGGFGAHAYAEAVSVYLSFTIDKCSDYWSSICSWISQLGAVRNTFARQAIPMVWDFVEVNPFSGKVGSFDSMLTWIEKVVINLVPANSGTIVQHDAQTVEYPKRTVVSTDPPYYDNISYADISDFFFSWMKPSLKEVFPSLFSVLATPKGDELIASPYRHGGKKEAEEFFLKGMSAAMMNISRQVDNEFPVTIYYAFKQSEIREEGISSTGWATFLHAVINAGFSIVGTWPVRTEFANRPVASGSNALASSVVLVCRKRNIESESISRAEFIRALKRELPPALRELQKASITPVDMPQASIGPGIGIYSRYSDVLENDDSKMEVKTALQIINRELDSFISEQEGDFDANTRFAVTWFEQNGMKSGAFGDADNLARARGLSVESVVHAGIIESGGNKVRLLSREELKADWSPTSDSNLTIWECVQYLIRALQDEGENAAAILLREMRPELTDATRDLAYRLFNICDKQNRAKEAGAYNALVAAWSDLTALAGRLPEGELTKEQLQLL